MIRRFNLSTFFFSFNSFKMIDSRKRPKEEAMKFGGRGDSPRRSSPKFPQPIFLPTRKLGPTMSTLDDEVTLCRDEWTFDRAAFPLPLEVRFVLSATSCSRSELRPPSSLSLPSRFCISYRPLLSTVAAKYLR